MATLTTTTPQTLADSVLFGVGWATAAHSTSITAPKIEIGL